MFFLIASYVVNNIFFSIQETELKKTINDVESHPKMTVLYPNLKNFLVVNKSDFLLRNLYELNFWIQQANLKKYLYVTKCSFG